jgi:hypothetical protein
MQFGDKHDRENHVGFYVGVARILNAYVPFLAEAYPPIWRAHRRIAE